MVYQDDLSRLRDIRDQKGFTYMADVISWLLDTAMSPHAQVEETLSEVHRLLGTVSEQIRSPYRDE